MDPIYIIRGSARCGGSAAAAAAGGGFSTASAAAAVVQTAQETTKTKGQAKGRDGAIRSTAVARRLALTAARAADAVR